MKSFLVIDDLVEPGPVFLNTVWPFASLMEELVGAEHLYVPHRKETVQPGVVRKVRERANALALSRSWRRAVQSRLDANGPNVLFVCAFHKRAIDLSRALFPIWDLFDKRVLMIEENIEPTLLPRELLERFDLVTVFCDDLRARYEPQIETKPVFLPPHTDVLRYASTDGFRPIDMLLVGRRRNEYHAPLFHHYSAPDSRRLFVDFVTRTQLDQTLEDEASLLLSTYGRAKVAFCYEPSDVPRFQNRSPLLVRWVHAWAAGCTVAGTRPRGQGAATQMDWEESMFDLPRDTSKAIDLLNDLLGDEAGLAKRRRRNVVEALGRHDSRLRIKFILDELDLPAPRALSRSLAELSSLKECIGNGQ